MLRELFLLGVSALSLLFVTVAVCSEGFTVLRIYDADVQGIAYDFVDRLQADCALGYPDIRYLI